MTVDIRSLLDRPVTSAKRPTLKPAGTYTGTIQGFKFDKSSRKNTPFVRLSINNCAPHIGPKGERDIKEEDLRDPEDGSPMDLSKWSPYHDYYLTDDALYIVRELMESCQIKVEGRSFTETIPELVNLPIILGYVHETLTDQNTGETRIVGKIGRMKGA